MLTIPFKPSFRELSRRLTGFNQDEEMIEALKVEAPHLLVTARAGSGKTTLIGLQTALSVLHGLKADQSLSLCFNRKAAQELTNRFERYGAPHAPASTFHALAYAIVRPKKGSLVCGERQERIIRSFLIPSVFDSEGDLDDVVRDILCFISRAKRQKEARERAFEGVNEHSQAFIGVCVRMFRLYEAHLKEHNLLDFDDLLEQAIQKLIRLPTLPFAYLHGILCDLSSLRLLCIDEFQDFSPQFYRLTRAIMDKNTSLRVFAVGDDWQSINGFAGSDPRYFRDFPAYFPQASSLSLLSNHRSGRAIVEYANKRMKGNGNGGIATKEGGSVERVNLARLFKGDHLSSLLEGERGRSVLLLARRNDPYGISLLRWEKELSRYHSSARASTIHAAKGTETDTVLLLKEPKVNWGSRLMPVLELLGHDQRQAEQEERHVSYVAHTRARERLIVIE